MPLPAALVAKLAKRGLINSKKNDSASKKEPRKKVHEEVIAEDYDIAKDDLEQIDIAQKFMGYIACPNKYNIYHDCSKKCKELWGKGHTQPSEKYLKRQIKLVQKYPLPDTWKAVYDPGSGIHYYWDWSSDLVSWLPPSHPKSQISQPASQLREELHIKEAEKDDNVSSDESGSDQEKEPEELEAPLIKRTRRDSREKDSHPDKDRDDSRDNRDRDSRDRHHRPNDPRRHNHHHRPNNRPDKESNKKDRTLDPMDPASYSDIPRGKWSDGLARQNEAKTGADTTASGPLFQMRPYPSPGAVLRSNKSGGKPDAEGNKDKESDSDEE